MTTHSFTTVHRTARRVVALEAQVKDLEEQLHARSHFESFLHLKVRWRGALCHSKHALL
jgi:guanyl-specific ribonuclease Sa